RHEQIDEGRRPEKSPRAAAAIERAFHAPPRPRQPGECAERAEPIARAPANDPAVQGRDNADHRGQWRREISFPREQKCARGERAAYVSAHVFHPERSEAESKDPAEVTLNLSQRDPLPASLREAAAGAASTSLGMTIYFPPLKHHRLSFGHHEHFFLDAMPA